MIENSKYEWAPDSKPMNWYKQFIKVPANQYRVGLVEKSAQDFLKIFLRGLKKNYLKIQYHLILTSFAQE